MGKTEKIFARYFERNRLFFQPDFPDGTNAVVVIPMLDDDELYESLACFGSLENKEGHAGIVIVVNHSETAPEEVKERNRRWAERLRKDVREGALKGLPCQIVEAFDLPEKEAGVGLARKIGMDAAAWWLWQQGRTDCPILSLDADTQVEPNYVDAVCRFFREHPVAGVSIAYAHRLEDCNGENLGAMVKYELYLRYYRAGLAYMGHPYAYTCIGSAFAVRASDYVAEGGMNKRQAGEDFYFIQKLIATGRYADLNTTTVHPSPRLSFRTPFGTGMALSGIGADGGRYPVYCWEAFEEIKRFFDGLDALFQADEAAARAYIAGQPEGLRKFLQATDVAGLIAEVNGNCASMPHFRKRFFDRFNAFRVLKCLNYLHDGHYEKEDISIASGKMFAAWGYPPLSSDREKLEYLRNHLRVNS